jgi:hypothetical protein
MPDLILILIFCKDLLPNVCKFNWFWILIFIFFVQGFSIFGLMLLIRVLCIFWLIREKILTNHLLIILGIYGLFDHLLLTSSVPLLIIFWLLHYGKIKVLDRTIIGFLIFNIFLAFYQILAQKSLGLAFFGEPILSQNITQIAKQEFGNLTIIKGYGLFQHPNIMGCVGIILLFWTNKNIKTLRIIGTILACLSLSRLGFLGLGFWIFLRIWKFKSRFSTILALSFAIIFGIFMTIWFLLRVPADAGRWIDLTNFIQLIQTFGPRELILGIKDYPTNITKLTNQTWQWQPVHNIFLLFLAEFGLFGALTAIFAIKEVRLDKK